jgi:hypothetical protein
MDSRKHTLRERFEHAIHDLPLQELAAQDITDEVLQDSVYTSFGGASHGGSPTQHIDLINDFI